ncbi:matrix metalloproteinase-21-like [Ambystoma mexicanum]|uniref:matrix metalloproteinase-21-like n=1 Tax=Ambystoma mexicanum TaxID=8296 RepID=UPI0037E76725
MDTMAHAVLARVLVAMLLMSSPVGTEKLFHSRDHSDIEEQSLPHAKAVVTPEAAQEYLTRYGWIAPVIWDEGVSDESSPATGVDKAPSDVSHVIIEDEPPKNLKDMHLTKSKIHSMFTESLKHFQKDNGLPVSGILDEPTKAAMNTPRCGVPDHEADGGLSNDTSGSNDTEISSPGGGATPTDHTNGAAGTNSRLRRRRSLTSLLGVHSYKRENAEPSSSLGFSKRTLTWRLMGEGYSMQLSIEQQRSILNMAFRIWSEVIPLQFQEDNMSTDIDIRVGFGTGQHLGCSKAFDGVGQQFAHAWFLGDIHFDDDEHFVGPASERGLSLLKVAVHEIGHALGLTHITRFGSVMHPNYTPGEGRFELDWEDRKAIQQKYGSCEGSFSTMFDWVRRETSPRGEALYRFNTYFFKDSWYWMYENRSNRTRFGDPIPIRAGWRGLPEMDIDAFVHVWTWSKDAQYVFKGTQVWRYDPDKDIAFTEDAQGKRYPQLISEAFPGICGPIDAAVFDKKDGLIYFFRGSNVTAFSVELHQRVSTFPKTIIDVFPAVDPEDHPVSNLDAVYFSYSFQATFFIKGTFYWRMVDDRDRKANASLPAKGLLPRSKINSRWFDICDVHPGMLHRPT